MKVLVTGGGGFIGSHIVDALIKAGHQPVIMDNFSSGSLDNIIYDVEIFDTDICNAEKVASDFDKIKPDWVCHQAANCSVSESMKNPAKDAQINIVGLLNVLENSAKHKVKKFVFASSGGTVYGENFNTIEEDSDTVPISAYGISKLTGEKYLNMYVMYHDLDCISLRYSNVYGPRQNPKGEAGVIAIFCRNILNDEKITINGDGNYVRDYVYCTDVAQANVKAFEKETMFREINISTGKRETVNGIAMKLISYISNEYFINTMVAFDKARKGDLRLNVLSPARAKLVLDWEPLISLDNGLIETIDYFYRYRQ